MARLDYFNKRKPLALIALVSADTASTLRVTSDQRGTHEDARYVTKYLTPESLKTGILAELFEYVRGEGFLYLPAGHPLLSITSSESESSA